MSKPIIEWIKSDEGYYHLCAFAEGALIAGFPQKTPTMSPTFGALIIKRKPVGVEPEVVALRHNGETFDIIKKYTIFDDSGDMYDWAYQSLLVTSSPISSRRGASGAPFVADLFHEAIIEGGMQGKTMYWSTNQPEIEA